MKKCFNADMKSMGIPWWFVGGIGGGSVCVGVVGFQNGFRPGSHKLIGDLDVFDVGVGVEVVQIDYSSDDVGDGLAGYVGDLHLALGIFKADDGYHRKIVGSFFHYSKGHHLVYSNVFRGQIFDHRAFL